MKVVYQKFRIEVKELNRFYSEQLHNMDANTNIFAVDLINLHQTAIKEFNLNFVAVSIISPVHAYYRMWIFLAISVCSTCHCYFQQHMFSII